MVDYDDTEIHDMLWNDRDKWVNSQLTRWERFLRKHLFFVITFFAFFNLTSAIIALITGHYRYTMVILCSVVCELLLFYMTTIRIYAKITQYNEYWRSNLRDATLSYYLDGIDMISPN